MNEGNNFAVKEIREKVLADTTLSLFEKDRYKEYLRMAAKFPQYSSNNQTLIWLQNKKATLVCGYTEWQKYGRHVMKDEKGIKILSPNYKVEWKEKLDPSGKPVLDKNGKPVKEKTKRFVGFGTATVFDVSQTAGDPIPSITSIFSGNIDGYAELLDVMRSVSPSLITFISGGESGYDPSSDTIRLQGDLNQQQTMQKLLPSVASALLYKQTETLYEPESLEAESCAYIIAKHFGFENDYDFDYISDWYDGKSLKELTETMKLIHSVSVSLITDISKAAKKAASA